MSRACLRCEQTKWLCRALKLPGGPKQTENVNSLWDSGPDLNISSDTLCDFFFTLMSMEDLKCHSKNKLTKWMHGTPQPPGGPTDVKSPCPDRVGKYTELTFGFMEWKLE